LVSPLKQTRHFTRRGGAVLPAARAAKTFQGACLGYTRLLNVEQMYFKCRCIFLVLLVCGPGMAWGDGQGLLPQDLTVRVWSKQQGLPDNFVTAVLQTRDGYLWVGTSDGLARFDGVRFVPLVAISEKTNDTVRVTALCEDSRGRLWIGTQGDGLFSSFDGLMTPYRANTNALDNTINSIAEDSAGDLWLGTPSGLNLLKKDRLMRFTDKDGLPNDFVSNVHVARSGTVWITTRAGMCQFKNGRISPFPFQTDSPGRNPESLGVYEDRRGNLWAFGDTYLVNLTEGKHLNHFGSGDNLSSLRIWSLCEGRHGELWIGTSGKGLFCFAKDKFSPVSLRNGGLTSDVRALCEDREGNLWLGTYGGGLVRLQPRNVRVLDASVGLPSRAAVCLALNPQGRAWIGFDRGGLYVGTAERFDRFSGEAATDLQNLVSSIAVAPDAGLWVGTLGAGVYCVANQRTVHYGTADGLSDNMVLAVAVDETAAIWAGTLSGGLNRIAAGIVTNFGTSSGLPDQPITAILSSPHGVLWLGYGNGAVVRGEADRFKTVIEPGVFNNKAIRALHQDPTGRIWIGTAGGHLACIVTGRYLKWDLNLDLADSAILGILSDDDGDLWLGTGKAIYHVAAADIRAALAGPVPVRCQPVYEADAVPGVAAAYGWPGAVKSADGKLWFGMAGGVVTHDPQRLMVDLTPLPVLIESVVANGVTQPFKPANTSGTATNRVAEAMRLPSDLRSLEIQFTALNLSAPEKVRFRHRLDGLDSDWVEDSSERNVHYGHLLFGNYTFRVQAGNGDTWDKNEAAFSFVVPTPWWRTAWALTIYVLMAVILVAGTARLASNRRLRRRLAVLAQQQAMERERMRIAQDMHDEIGSKLTKISFMSERARGELQGQEPVARKLNSIANTSRDLLQSLDEIVWAVNPHNDTLEHLAAYLGHYATEYLQNTSVECELHIPQGLPHHPLSAEARHNLFLAFEESLNNALKHGRASRIRVDMQAEPGLFEINVEDNGCGFDVEAITSAKHDPTVLVEKRIGNGMQNLRQRLADVGGQCSIRSQPGQGTTVTLTVPLGTARSQTKRK
jgi:signal transduction histidine kinase/ligand-binding sensor domain-containing protein